MKASFILVQFFHLTMVAIMFTTSCTSKHHDAADKNFNLKTTSQILVTSESGEKMAADLVFLRPAGILALTLGSLAFVVSVPFSALGGNTKEAYEEMVKKPALYTFKRPLGDF